MELPAMYFCSVGKSLLLSNAVGRVPKGTIRTHVGEDISEMLLLFFAVCLGASTIGSICGIGGGVIIKPVLDTLGLLDVVTINFLSGCTVLAMTAYSVAKSKLSGVSQIDKRNSLPLALGAAVGGIIGKWAFSYIRAMSENPNRIGMVQAVCLALVTAGSLLYTVRKDKIKAMKIESRAVCLLIGAALGVMSSFLGIGGGPINLVVLYYFFSMSTKEAVENSLYIIFFSQIASLVSTLVTKSIPAFSASILLVMIAGGIIGGICGRAVNGKMKESTLERLFIVLMMAIIIISLYNFINLM